MTCPTAARLRGRFRVFTNENFGQRSDAPQTTVLSVVDDSVSDDAARSFVTWLECEYHRNKMPFQFDDTVAVQCVEFPDDGIVDRTVAMMLAKGWSISVQQHECAGGRAATITLCPPRSASR